MPRPITQGLLAAVLAAGFLLVPTSQQAEADDYWKSYWNWYDGSYRPYYRNHYRNYGRDYGYYDNRGYRNYDYGYSYGVPGATYYRYPHSRRDQRWSHRHDAYQIGPLRVERWH